MRVLESNRLSMRRLQLTDAEFIFGLVNQPSWLRFIGDKNVRDLDDARNYLRTGPLDMYQRFGFGMFMVERKDDGAAVGACGLLKRDILPEPDLGYAFLPEFWGQGYALEAATEPLETSGYQVEFGGPVPENVQEVSGHAEMTGVVVALLILLLAFGALLAASLPLVVAITGLLVGTGGITLLATLTDMSTNAPTLASMVGLGVGIDYALFIVTRHRDNLARGMSVPEAAGRATATAGQSVIFAGGTVLVALAGLQFSGVPDFATMGYATGLVVLVTVLAAVTLLVMANDAIVDGYDASELSRSDGVAPLGAVRVPLR